jgi:hypothetical protein
VAEEMKKIKALYKMYEKTYDDVYLSERMMNLAKQLKPRKADPKKVT